MTEAKRVAAIVTEYRRHSHADVIVGKILEGFNYQGKDFPNMRLVSMYVDQFPKSDMSRDLAQRYKFTIYDNIEDAVTLRQNRVGVDGVLIIGEHGDYPTNELGQRMYPRRRFFEAVMNVFAKHRRAVPVFNDKHLSYSWENASWMYNRARELGVPLMAGSSLPVTWRRPQLAFPRDTPLEEAVQIGYGPFEGYGFHALEGLQCLAEYRRPLTPSPSPPGGEGKGVRGETGVRSVQLLQGDAMWDALDSGRWSRELLESALALVPAHANADYRTTTAKTADAGVFLIEYRDGFKAAVAMLNGWLYEGDGGAFIFAGRVRGRTKPLATHFYLQNLDPFAHFAYQVRAIDHMMQTGHAAYPAARTLLTTGILDAVMISKSQKGRRIDTPHLDIRYQPTGWSFATDPVPPIVKR